MGKVNDTVGDALTRLRNAHLAKEKRVLIPKAKITCRIAEILQQENFIESYREVKETPYLSFELLYKGRKSAPSITRLTRISKPGLRVYANKNQIPRVLGGIGIAILSTSQGVMTDKEARKKNIGGEVLCHIW